MPALRGKTMTAPASPLFTIKGKTYTTARPAAAAIAAATAVRQYFGKPRVDGVSHEEDPLALIIDQDTGVGELLDVLLQALPYVEDAIHDPAYKRQSVQMFVDRIRRTIREIDPGAFTAAPSGTPS